MGPNLKDCYPYKNGKLATEAGTHTHTEKAMWTWDGVMRQPAEELQTPKIVNKNRQELGENHGTDSSSLPSGKKRTKTKTKANKPKNTHKRPLRLPASRTGPPDMSVFAATQWVALCDSSLCKLTQASCSLIHELDGTVDCTWTVCKRSFISKTNFNTFSHFIFPRCLWGK